MTQLRILVVEDDPDGAAVVRMILRLAGIETIVFENAENALEQLRANPDQYDLVIADLALPAMDGIEMFHHMRQEAELAHLKVIAVTAYHTPELKAKLLNDGFDGYFPKPLDTTHFVPALARLLDQ